MLGASLGLVVVLVLRAERAPVEVEESSVRRDPVRLELGARVDLRSGQPEGTTGTNLTDVEIDPVLGIRLPFRLGSLTLVYEPRLFLVVREYPPQEARKVSYLNRARLVLETTPGPRWRVYVEGRFAYGDNDFLPLSTVATPVPGTGAPPVQPGTTPTAPSPAPGQTSLPDTRFLRVIDLDASAGLVYALSPRLGWRLSAGYLYSGGADAEVRATLPLQKGPHGSTGLEWSASRADTLVLLLDGSNLRFSNGPQSTLATLTMTWTRAWGRSVGTDLLAGAGGLHATTTAAPPVRNTAYPVGGLGLRYTWANRFVSWQNGFTVLAAPAPDRLSGLVSERLSAGLRSAFSPVKQLTFEAIGAASRSIDGPPQRDVRLEGRATYLLGAQLGISLGGRVAWLEGSTLLGAQGFGWVAFLSVGTSGGTSLFGDSE
jgi:hypothetical protein